MAVIKEKEIEDHVIIQSFDFRTLQYLHQKYPDIKTAMLIEDYMVNLKSELEIRILHEKLDHLIVVQQEKLMEIQQIQIDMLNDIMQKMKK